MDVFQLPLIILEKRWKVKEVLYTYGNFPMNSHVMNFTNNLCFKTNLLWLVYLEILLKDCST